MKKMLFVTALLLVVNAQARASTTYTYVGNNFTDIANFLFPPGKGYTSSMSMRGSIELADPIPVNTSGEYSTLALDFAFSDGQTVIDKASAVATRTVLTLGTDGTGNIS